MSRVCVRRQRGWTSMSGARARGSLQSSSGAHHRTGTWIAVATKDHFSRRTLHLRDTVDNRPFRDVGEKPAPRGPGRGCERPALATCAARRDDTWGTPHGPLGDVSKSVSCATIRPSGRCARARRCGIPNRARPPVWSWIWLRPTRVWTVCLTLGAENVWDHGHGVPGGR